MDDDILVGQTIHRTREILQQWRGSEPLADNAPSNSNSPATALPSSSPSAGSPSEAETLPGHWSTWNGIQDPASYLHHGVNRRLTNPVPSLIPSYEIINGTLNGQAAWLARYSATGSVLSLGGALPFNNRHQREAGSPIAYGLELSTDPPAASEAPLQPGPGFRGAPTSRLGQHPYPTLVGSQAVHGPSYPNYSHGGISRALAHPLLGSMPSAPTHPFPAQAPANTTYPSWFPPTSPLHITELQSARAGQEELPGSICTPWSTSPAQRQASYTTGRKRKKTTSLDPVKTSQLKRARRFGDKGGSCIQCQDKKEACSLEEVCGSCIKRHGNIFASRICLRYDFRVLEYREKHTLDLYAPRHPLPDVSTAGGQSSIDRLVLGHPLQLRQHSLVYYPHAPTLTVDIRQFDDPALYTEGAGSRYKESQGRLKEALSAMFSFPGEPEEQTELFFSHFFPLEGTEKQYLVLPDSFPPLKNLIDWANFDIEDRHKVFPNDVESVLDGFFAAYVDRTPKLPHRDLVELVLNAVSLGRLLDSGRPIDHAKFDQAMSELEVAEQDNNTGEQAYQTKQVVSMSLLAWKDATSLPEMARAQIFECIAKCLQPLELDALRRIDKFVQERISAPKGDPLICSLLIRRLMLHYRRTMIQCRIFGDALEDRRTVARDMYDRLTRHYAVSFTGTMTPFGKDWDLEQHRDALADDPKLKDLFAKLKSAEKYHFHHELSHEDDGVFKKLFLEHVNKKQSSISSRWSREPVSESQPLAIPNVSQQFQRWIMVNESHHGLTESSATPNFASESIGQAVGISGPSSQQDQERVCPRLRRAKTRLRFFFTLMRSLKAMGEYQPRLWLEMVVLALKALYVNRSLREIGNCAKESKLSRPEGTVEVEVFSSQDVNRGGT